MPRTRNLYPAEFREQIVALARAGRSVESAEARMAIFEFIEGWYNPARRHSALGYQSPIAYERKQAERLEPASP